MFQTHFTEHTITISTPPEIAYRVVADVGRWSSFFPPTVHAQRVSGDDLKEVIRIWAVANGEVKTWTSRRDLDPSAYRIAFRQEASPAPAESMGGEWSFEPRSDGATTVVLKHDFSAIDDDAAAVEWIRRAVDHNSRAELASLKRAAEQSASPEESILSFADTVLVKAPVKDAYAFIYRCQDWPSRLPHVARVELREDLLGVQLMEMDTRSPDGSVHTTKSVRVCVPGERIIYKQTQVPAIMTSHTGEWRFEETAEGVEVTSAHRVVVDRDAIPAQLGADATIEEARQRVQQALSANSMTTLLRAKAFAEGDGHA